MRHSGNVYETFGITKHEPIKPLQSLLDVTPLKLALSAKCTIHDVTVWCSLISVISFFNLLHFFCQSSVGKDILFCNFWLVCQLVRIANVYDSGTGYNIFNQINSPLIPPMLTIPKITNSNIFINLVCLS